jgi:hypothetical protein
MTTVPKPQVHSTGYTVSCLPYDDINAEAFSIQVDYTGHGRWAVRQRGRRCLAADGRWDWEPIPSERTDEWLAKYRFDLDTALRLAKEQAPLIKVNGRTVEQVLAWYEARQA